MAPPRPALVLLEFQRQWTDPGVYRRLLEPDLTRRNVVNAAVNLAGVARTAGAPVVHAPLIVDPRHLRGRFAQLTRGRVFTKGHRRSAFTEGIYRDDDRVVTGRTGFDGFIDSDLLTQLHETGVQRVLLAGFATDQCVGRTWRTALQYGFDAYVVTDCTATFSAWLQRRARKRFGGRALTLRQARDMLEGTPQ